MIALAGSMPQGIDDAGSGADVFAVLPLRRRHGLASIYQSPAAGFEVTGSISNFDRRDRFPARPPRSRHRRVGD